MRVRYERQALAARNHLIAQRDDPTSAARLYERFAAAKALLGQFPEIGRLGHRPNTRELVITGTSYLFIYRIDEQGVDILDIRHTGRKP